MISNAMSKMFESILANDIYILGAAIVTLFFFLWCLISTSATKRDFKNEKKVNAVWARRTYKSMRIPYTVFVALISMFPLFGMFGTVCGLLGLDLAAGDMENIKNNFFMALTSTAWGIFFSVIYKFINAFLEGYVEEQIDAVKKVLDESRES